MIFSSMSKYRDLGLLIIRVFVGIAYIGYGYPKVTGGLETWESVGGAMGIFGITFAPAFWGALASFTEFLGGFLLIIGLAFRPACLLLAFTMLVATLSHYFGGDPFHAYAHPAKMCAIFIGLFLIGPGKYSLDRK